jgi:hypothetical protein
MPYRPQAFVDVAQTVSVVVHAAGLWHPARAEQASRLVLLLTLVDAAAATQQVRSRLWRLLPQASATRPL